MVIVVMMMMMIMLRVWCISYTVVCQRGDVLFPRGEDGELVYEDIHYIETWKVCILLVLLYTRHNQFEATDLDC